MPPETEPPDPQCLSYTHDVGYGRYRIPRGEGRVREDGVYPPEADQVKVK